MDNATLTVAVQVLGVTFCVAAIVWTYREERRLAREGREPRHPGPFGDACYHKWGGEWHRHDGRGRWVPAHRICTKATRRHSAER